MENADYQTVEGFNAKEKRPGGLTVLCVLTFLGSGISFLFQLFSFAFYDVIPGIMEAAAENMNGAPADAYRDIIDLFISMPRYVFLVSAILYVFSVSGAAIMLAMRKIGFHVYAVAQLLIIFVPQLLRKMPLSWTDTGWNLLIAIAFIALYFMYYKKME